MSVDLDAIRRRIPEIPRADMSNAERDRADLLALLGEARELISTLGEALKSTSPYIDTNLSDPYTRAPGRQEAISAYFAYLARFSAPSPTDEEKK